MSVNPISNGFGLHERWFATGDSLGRALMDRAWRYGEHSPVLHLPGGVVWRYPRQYRRTITNIKQSALSRYAGIGPYNVAGENSGTLLASHVGGRFGEHTFNPSYEMYNELTTRCLNKLGSQKAQLGATLAEMRKTLNMIASSAITLLSAYRAARRGNWWLVLQLLGRPPGSAKKFHGGIPNRWLEYQYGWKPLMGDISGAYGVLQDLFKPDPDLLLHAVSKKSNKWSGAESTRLDIVWQGKEVQVMRLDAVISQPRLRTASQLGLINPYEVLWEIVPFSFLLDWFMPVGNVLSAITSTEGLTFVSGTHTYTGEGFVTIHRTPAYLPSWPLTDPGSVEVERYDMVRNVLPGWPVPGLYVTDNPLSTPRVKNALALFLAAL